MCVCREMCEVEKKEKRERKKRGTDLNQHTITIVRCPMHGLNVECWGDTIKIETFSSNDLPCAFFLMFSIGHLISYISPDLAQCTCACSIHGTTWKIGGGARTASLYWPYSDQTNSECVCVCVCISMDIRIIMLVCESSCPATHICIYTHCSSTVIEVGMPGDDHLLGENPCFKTPL